VTHDRGHRAARDGSPLATYRIAVGKRHKIEPRQIVGAIANEGGLSRQDFGAISIRPDFSLVELPAELSPETWEKLRSTRISGKLIGLKKDDGPPSSRSSSFSRPPDKKPRHKKA
jgi:ATP-dependent RNA helicase DeaD